MKIQKQLSKKRGNKIYYKYVLVIPSEKIKEAELKEGDELEIKSEKHKLTIKKL